MDACEVREQMGRYAALSAPFFFMLDYEGAKGIFISDPACLQPGHETDFSQDTGEPFRSSRVLFQIGTRKNYTGPQQGLRVRPVWKIEPPPYTVYRKAFDNVRAGLLRGDSFLLNLTARSRIETDLSFHEIFFHSKAPYKVLLPGSFVCFSPEIFVRINQGVISAYPMKGTIPAEVPDAPQKLLDDYKETCEHATVVDLLRNDLSSVAQQVRVKRYRYMEKIPVLDGKAIWQSSSEISGVLPDNWKRNLGEIIGGLLPAGSISGAPKSSTCRLIAESETVPRGWYTGVCGYFDGERLDTAVMIRCIAVDPMSGQRYFYSGGGITVHSRAEDEYAELITKVYLPV